MRAQILVKWNPTIGATLTGSPSPSVLRWIGAEQTGR
jgi:hypothetical protein